MSGDNGGGGAGDTVRAWVVVLAAMVMALEGCAAKPKDQPDLAPATGAVTLDGQPLAGVVVVFTSESGRSATGATDAAGRYEIAYGGTRGAVLGPNTVSISTRLDHPPAPDWKDPIPEKYNQKSELKVDVAKGTNTFDFSLEGTQSR